MEWKEEKLGDICENLDNLRVPITKKDRVEGGVPYYGASGIVDYVKDFIFDEDLLLVSEDGANLLARTYPIAFSVTGKTWVNNHAHALKFNEPVTQKFVEYYLNSISLKDFISGMAQPKLNQKSLNSIPVSIPAISEQKRIVALLDTVFADLEQTRSKTEQNLKNARELFDSYLQQVFSQKGEGWIDKTLGEAVVVERGSSPRPIKKYQTDSTDGVNWIKIGDTKGITKYITSTKEKITKEGAEKSRRVDAGDFILSNSMSFGKPYIMGISGYIHDGWFVFRLPDYIDTEFFYYLLSSPFVQKQFQTLSSGAIVKNISGDLVKKASLPIPPLSVQKTIASKLDETSKEIEKLESIYTKKLNSMDELKKSILQKAFSGELTANAK